MGCVQSGDGRAWACLDSDRFWNMGDFSTPERKSAFQLRGNVDSFVEHFRQDHCAFWTLTDLEGITPREFARRWNSFITHHGEWIRAFVRVLEPQVNGNPHYHLLVAVPWNMRPADFDWEAFRAAARKKGETKAEFRTRQQTKEWREMRRRYVASSAPETVALWKRLRKHREAYGLGRSEFVPVRKLGAITEYIGKYLEAGIRIRIHGWKGARRVETDRRSSRIWKSHSRVFSWVSPGACRWRARVAELAGLLGAADLGDIACDLGPKWAYWLRGYMTAPVEEWREAAPILIRLLRQRQKEPTKPSKVRSA